MAIAKELLPSYVDALISSLKNDSSWVVRREAAAALGQLGDPRAVEVLIGTLRDMDEDLQKEAANALRNMGVHAARGMIGVLAGADEKFKKLAHRFLCEMNVLPVSLLKPLLTDQNAEIRKLAVEIFGIREDEQGIPILMEMLSDPASEVRKAVLHALERIDLEKAKTAALMLAHDSDQSVRMASFNLAGKYLLMEFLDPLIKALSDLGAVIRVKAAEILGTLGNHDAVEHLGNALKDHEPSVRAKSAEALARLGATQALPLLTQAANDPHPEAQARITEAIYILQTEKPESELIADLQDERPAIRRIAAMKLSHTDGKQAVDSLVQALLDTDQIVRSHAVTALIRRNEKKSYSPLIRTLDHPSVPTRTKISRHFEAQGPAVSGVLVEETDNRNEEICKEVVLLLGKIKDAKTIPALVKALAHSSPRVQVAAALAMGNMGTVAVDPLLPLLSNPVAQIRWAVLEAFKRIGGVQVIQPVLRVAQTAEVDVREKAVSVLVAVGNPVLHTLVESLNDESPVIRGIIANVLGKIRNSGAVAPLMLKLNDENVTVRKRVVEALSEFSSPEITQKMLELIKDSDPSIRLQASWYLAQHMDSQASQPLVDLLRGGNASVREEAAWVLSAMRNLPVEVPAKCLEDKDPKVRAVSAQILGCRGGKEAAHALTRALKDTSPEVREKAVRSIAAIGDAESMEALRTVLQDSDEKVRAAATKAVGVIGSTEKVGLERKCPDCGGPLRQKVEQGGSFSPALFWAYMIIGLVLAPVVIGIFLILSAWKMKTSQTRYLVCSHCKSSVALKWHE